MAENRGGFFKSEKAEKEKSYCYRNGLRFEKTPMGLVFSPVFNGANRKHNCPDCMTCAVCADARCEVCLDGAGRCK